MEKFKRLKNNSKRNKIQVVLANSGLRDLKEEIEYKSEQEKETENPNEIVNIVEKSLKFNGQQSGQELKILTPDQMLNRLPISLAQLNARNNSIKLKKAKLGNYCILCTDQKNLQNKSIEVWLILFKTWKQFSWTMKTVKQVTHTDLNWI